MKNVHYAWWIMLACCAISSCMGFVTVAGGNFYRPVAVELGVGVGQLALYMTVMSLTMAALFSTAGKLLAKNLKWSLLIGGLLQYIPYGLMSCFTNVYQFYVAGFFIGVGSSITLFMAVPILINMWFVEKKGLAMGIAMGFSGVAGAIASMIAGFTIPAFGWRMSYVILAVIGCSIFVPMVFFLVKTPQEKGVLPYGYQAVNSDTMVCQTAVTEEKSLPPADVKRALICMLLCGSALAVASALGTQVSAFSTGHFGLSVGMAATMVSISTIGTLVGKISLGAIDDRFGHAFAFVLGIGLIVISQILLLAVKGTTVLLMGSVFLTGLALTTYTILLPLLTGAIFGQKDYSKYWAYIMSAGSIIGAFATPIYGAMFDKTGEYTLVFIVVIVATIIGGAMGISALRIGAKRQVTGK